MKPNSRTMMDALQANSSTESRALASSSDHQPQDIPRPPSPAFFEQIKHWIAECGSRHGPCPMLHAEPHSLPTRVLKITPRDAGFRVQLYEGKGEKVWYTTLSHCWGFHRPLTTTKANLTTHLHEIEWSILPKTFQDAAIITHGCGVQYLWIDSLCIVQDDEDDWKRESSQMKDIYSLSYLTIAAAMGRDSRHGLLPPEHAGDSRSIGCIRDALMTDASPSPLSDRAWVLQERLLSARILYCCDEEVVMECSNHTRCQCRGVDTSLPSPPDAVDRLGIDTGKEKTYETLRHRFQKTILQMFSCRLAGIGRLSQLPVSEWDLAPRLPFNESNKSLRLWDEITAHYCRRKITRLSDRVTALAGIASVFGSTGAYGQYYAGLWEVWFVHMLLWYIGLSNDGNDDLVPKPHSNDDPPLAPSWSWAKVRGSWLYRRPPVTRAQQVLAEFTHAELHLAVPERFREVEKAVVTIQGIVMTVEVRYDSMPEGLTYAERFRRQQVKLVKEDGEEARMYKDFVLDEGPEPIKSGDQVQLLPIHADHYDGLMMVSPGFFVVSTVVRGVVLKGVQGDDNLFTRIGVFQCPVEWLPLYEPREIRIC